MRPSEVIKQLAELRESWRKQSFSYTIEQQRQLRKTQPDEAAPLIHHYRDRLKPKLKEMINKKNQDSQN